MPISITGLDENMEGGIPRGSNILIAGSSGTMKSSVCFNALYKEAQAGNNVLYISMEQTYVSLLNQMINMGYDFEKIDVTIIGSDQNIIRKKIKQISESRKGHLILSDLGSLRVNKKDDDRLDWWVTVSNIVKVLKEGADISAIVLDSLNTLYVLTSFNNPRKKIFQVFNFFKELKLTSFFISEMPKDGSKYSEYEIEDFIADGVIVIQLVERNRKVTREINVTKMRQTNVNTDVFTLEYARGGFKALYGGKMPIL